MSETAPSPEEKEVLFLDRDLSWLSFNEKVLEQAAATGVPLLEKIKFLSIYSSNLDEFYRVRIPALTALKKLSPKKNGKERQRYSNSLKHITTEVHRQQQFFGTLFQNEILPGLNQENITLIYNMPIPEEIMEEASRYFFTQVLAYIKPMPLVEEADFFLENNRLYFLADIKDGEGEHLYIVNIPSEELPRFYAITKEGKQYIVFLDDIIKAHLDFIFPGSSIEGAYSFKITRDAALEFDDDYDEDLAAKMEKKVAKRDFGIATRFLYDHRIPTEYLNMLVKVLGLKGVILMEGGCYHNLKDLASLPVHRDALEYPTWPAVPYAITEPSLLQEVAQKDIIINTPYQSYDTVLRFFNEASVNKDVEEIYVTVYRVASDSKIANALMSAACNGKKVTVIVELKARFDESNNIKWSKKLSEAGVTIIHSVPSLKVHAKIALVKFRKGHDIKAIGLLATGNLNESTARFYTDHILLTAHTGMMKELREVFRFLGKKKKPDPAEAEFYKFKHLLVAQFNLRDTFIELIDREIYNQKNGLAARITIKLNNLEEEVLINKLYEASAAGVKIELIVRGICRLVPGIKGVSGTITVKRIIDRYLEHGRVFIFHNNGNEEVYLGSADWMNRNIYRRIEVCFPVYNEQIKKELQRLVLLQLKDSNEPGEARSQQKIYEYLSSPKS